MTIEYRKGAHTTFDLRYHIVWCSKYRYKVLVGDLAIRARDMIREICRTHEINILSGKVGKEHVHMYAAIPPYISISKAVQYIKGKSSRKLQMEFSDLKRRYWGQHLWSRGYFVASVGEISDELIRNYIENQDDHHHDDQFTVSEE